MTLSNSVIRVPAGLLAAILILLPSSHGHAGEIAAIVEDINNPAVGVAPMDVLEEGRIIQLASGDKLVLGYLRSCIRETITNGKVTIGEEKSVVVGGKRVEDEVDCDGGSVVESAGRSSDVAGAVFRKGKNGGKPLPKPGWTLFGVSPIVRFAHPTKSIRIERLDKSGTTAINVAVTGSTVDLAKKGIKLEPGGLYLMSHNQASYVVKISPLAEPDATVLSRVLPM